MGKRTSWWCQPTEPGETSQSSSEPSLRAAATWEAQGEVASATTGEGDHSTAPPPQRWTRSLSMDWRGRCDGGAGNPDAPEGSGRGPQPLDVPEQGGARVEWAALDRGGSPLVRVLWETKSSRVGWSTTPRRRIWSGPGGPQPTYVRTKGSKASLSFIKSKLVLSYFLLLCTLANVELPFFCKELIYFL